ncbi:MAG TPA: NAD-dependent protein deacetylase [Myxococcota bacterium]|nr:NAD-dependent protein deacetylase [Myxococcota bacterium]
MSLPAPQDRAVTLEVAALLQGRRWVALTGAGCSTESGIPDYRGPDSKPRTPIQFKDFMASEQARARYWARSRRGWPHFSRARPNPSHHALAELETAGLVGIITQNVDRLHQRAGSRRVVDLHGALEEVLCLGCGALSDREELQRRLEEANPGERAEVPLAPDGDAEGESGEGFSVPACLRCGGILKPHVVFFGENVPPPRLAEAKALFGQAECLLVAGSSLTVFSGYRFVRWAAEAGIPVVILNQGPTRGDPLATLKWEQRTGVALPELGRVLRGSPMLREKDRE